MRKTPLSLVMAALLIGGVAGCGGADQPSVPPSASVPAPPSVPTPAGSAPAPTTSTATVSSAATPSVTPSTTTGTVGTGEAFPLTVSRRGGFAGVDDSVRITADGKAVVTRRGRPPVRTTLSAGTVAELRRLVTTPGLTGRAPTRSGPSSVCNDAYEYEIVSPSATTSVRGCGTPHGAALNRLLAIVGDLLRA